MKSVKYLLLIGELEGCSAHLKDLEEFEDRAAIKALCSKYYKLYFSTKKYEQKS
tara:strand:+ start:155 stop:316 length:162 start_codon:yes stop_codon:yes gene_type:complete